MKGKIYKGYKSYDFIICRKMEHIFSKPNQITFIRILLIPVFVMFLLIDIAYRDYIAAFIFIILSLSDALDGYIARKKSQVTGIGKIIDPIADKLLISSALIFLIPRVELWMAVVIIAREIIITIARIFFLPRGVIISASNLGKIKTISQIIAIVAVILNVPFNWWLMLIAVIITIVSGLDHLIKMGKLSGENVINIPNLITTFRLLLIPLFIINLIKSNVNYALVIFTVIALSDKLDGISARIAKHVTKFGRIYDAFIDFILIVSSLIAFYIMGLLELSWILILLIPPALLTLTKISHYRKLKETASSTLGKVVVGISYVAIFSIIIDFIYKFEILVIVALLAYSYVIVDVYKIWVKRDSRSVKP